MSKKSKKKPGSKSVRQGAFIHLENKNPDPVQLDTFLRGHWDEGGRSGKQDGRQEENEQNVHGDENLAKDKRQVYKLQELIVENQIENDIQGSS
ncbi:unnamed protein product [Pieris brassicae]|uniref:Uncharacterized protein n=1 Tax=Pieris brassicae TaxID=7116 RepID=A0A9P0XGW4_PIEBR|nr:unnamed protein product [Pieris brassicae]